MIKSPTALDVNRRGFLGMLFGAATTLVVAPAIAKVAALQSQWGALLRKLRGLVSLNPVTKVLVRMGPSTFADAFSQVERWDLQVRHVYMHPDTYESLRYDCATGRHHDLLDEGGVEPKLWGATVHVTDEVSRKEAFVMHSPDDPRGVAEIRVIS